MRVSRISLLVVLILFAAPTLLADYTYQEKTQITGGSILRMMRMMGHFSSEARKAEDPVVSTIYLKGNRMARVEPESIEIIDLDKETITDVDLLKKTYTVLTFEQMKQQIAYAREQMRKKHAEQQASEPQASEPQANPNADDVKVSFDVKVRKTGAEKQVDGLSGKEAILTMTMNATNQKTQQSGSMAITNDMWMVPEIPGYEQVRDFQRRFAEKMGNALVGLGADMGRALAQNPGATDAMADMGNEMRKLDGVPVQQIMRMGTTTNGQPLQAASEAPLPEDHSPAMPSAKEVVKESAASMVTSRLPFGGFGHKKKQNAEPPTEQKANAAEQPTSAVFMESETTVSNFSSGTVDESHFEVPSGFKMVQPQRPAER